MAKKPAIFIVVVGVFMMHFFAADNVFADYTLSMTTSGPQSVDILPGSASTSTNISQDSITVNTSCRYGYNLNIGVSVNNNNLYLNGNSSNNAAGTYLSPSNGTTTLANSPNTWGYYYHASNAPTSSSIFNPLPTLNNPSASVVSERSEPASANISESFSIYYGAAVSNTLPSGSYKMIPDSANNNNPGSIVYYLTIANRCNSYNIVFNPTSTSTGTSVSGTGTMADQEAYQDVPVTLSPNAFTAPTGYRFKEWNTAQDGSGTSYADEASVTNLAASGSSATLYAIWMIDLYDTVASMTKNTQTLAQLQANISASNSGVYTYNSSDFGSDSDGVRQDNTKATIYYYRGILDSSFTSSTYGSSGDGALSPNYVILSPNGTKSTTDTCWRIFRTTGSGGVKMIYNGRWTGTTCANAQTAAQTGASYYNSTDSTNARAIANAGYTFNTYGSSTSTTAISVDTIFGSNTNFSSNTNASTIKTSVDNWYNSNLTSYTSILEPNAGFCNDRKTYTNTAGTTEATRLRPYGSNSQNNTTAYFGAYARNYYNSSTRVPSLTCTRNNADVYTTSTASGGNGQLSVPAALITADELSLSGSGGQTANFGSTYSTSGFLRTGSNFWTMTPHSRTTSNSRATMMSYSYSTGYLGSASMYTSYGVRPVISLKEGTGAIIGTGTAVNPWVVTAP